MDQQTIAEAATLYGMLVAANVSFLNAARNPDKFGQVQQFEIVPSRNPLLAADLIGGFASTDGDVMKGKM